MLNLKGVKWDSQSLKSVLGSKKPEKVKRQAQRSLLKDKKTGSEKSAWNDRLGEV